MQAEIALIGYIWIRALHLRDASAPPWSLHDSDHTVTVHI
jgi:hypothetical protein